MAPVEHLGFPWWLRISHWFNALFFTLLVRSGLQILAAHPKLYWKLNCYPGSEWLKFGKQRDYSAEELFTSEDEEEDFGPFLALPGGHQLGLGRYWHFTSAILWLLTGACYVVGLFVTPEWHRLIPLHSSIFPDAWHALLTYLSFHTPPPGTTENPLAPFNGLQQLAYFLVIFWLCPHMILTGIAMSPTLAAHFPRYQRIFFQKQAARSLHFIGLVLFLAFLLIHLITVFWHGFPEEMGKIVLGEEHTDRALLATLLGVAILLTIVAIHVAATIASRRRPRAVHDLLSPLVDPMREWLFGGEKLASRQHYPTRVISPYHRVNGYPPIARYPKVSTPEYIALESRGFRDWKLEVKGLVDTPLALSLEDLRALPATEQTVLHTCIQGWTAIGRWKGVHLEHIVSLCHPRPEARYIAFWSYQRHQKSGKIYYECLNLELAFLPQTILAYELNGEPLPVAHGAPLRLRVETKYGYKMVKFLRSLEFVEDYRLVRGGRGGVREDEQQYGMGAQI